MRYTLIFFMLLLARLSLAQTKPILWDATKTNIEIQNAVSASKAATTATATSYTLPAGTTPTASVSLNNGNFAFTFGLPVSATVTSGSATSGTTTAPASATSVLLVDGLDNTGNPQPEGSTTLVDRSAQAHAVTASGGAKSTQLQNKYGGGSIEFVGGNPVVLVTEKSPSVSLFGTADFEVDLWLRMTAFPASNSSYAVVGRTSSSAQDWVVNIKGSGTGTAFAIWDAGGTGADNVAATTQLVLNTWHNIVVTSQTDGRRIFVDGILRGFTTNKTSPEIRNITNSQISYGGYTTGGGSNYIGHLQSKISKGVQTVHQTTSTTTGTTVFTPISPFTP